MITVLLFFSDWRSETGEEFVKSASAGRRVKNIDLSSPELML